MIINNKIINYDVEIYVPISLQDGRMWVIVNGIVFYWSRYDKKWIQRGVDRKDIDEWCKKVDIEYVKNMFIIQFENLKKLLEKECSTK